MSDIRAGLPAAEQPAFNPTPVVPQAPAPKAPRLWPGVVIVILMWCGYLIPARLAEGTMIHFYGLFMSGMVGAFAIVLWWLTYSRVRLVDRLLILAAFFGFGACLLAVGDETFDLMPIMLYSLRVVVTVWVVYLLLTPFLSWNVRRVGLIVALFLAWGYFASLRFDGVTGSMVGETAYRWELKAEDRHRLAREAGTVAEADAGADALPAAEPAGPGDWAAFRGDGRDSRVVGVQLTANWNEQKPRLLWKHLVGPGWSSMAVVGKRVFTQEQWDSNELVVCYHADTGKILWKHEDPARFSERVAGPGPRATPTYQDGKVYSLGASGILNCLDASTGNKIWSRSLMDIPGAKTPIWGFASSPLVAGGNVIVFAGAKDGKSVIAYKANTGEIAWSGGEGDHSYSSAQLTRISDRDLVLIATNAGVQAFEPKTGEVLWTMSWPVEQVARIVQPALVGGSDLLIGTGMEVGTKRIHVSYSEPDGKWSIQEVWPEASRAFKPYFNDFVVYNDHLYGFDGHYLTCIRASDGKKQWRERGYGNGQLLLLVDQGALLVLSEEGAVALVEARPDELHELCRFQAIEGKTWNHPVLANGRLYVRNGAEMACFELPLASPSPKTGN